jgi:hypothetical protein
VVGGRHVGHVGCLKRLDPMCTFSKLNLKNDLKTNISGFLILKECLLYSVNCKGDYNSVWTGQLRALVILEYSSNQSCES